MHNYTDDVEISLDQILEDLESVDDWQTLGHFLRVDAPMTTNIKAMYEEKSGIIGCKRELLNTWRIIYPWKSCKHVILALEQLSEKHRALATTLKFKYCLSKPCI